MYVIKGGCGAHHSASFRKSWPNGLDNPVLLILRSRGDFSVGGKHFLMEPGDAIMIAPHTPYHYHNPYGEYIDDWMHIGLNEDESLPAELPCNVPFHLNDREACSTLIRQLLWESAYTEERYLKQNTDALFTVLMNHLIAAPRAFSGVDEISYTERLKDIRFHMQHTLSEEHTIHSHAQELGISDSHFQHLYTTVFGVPFQQDLIRMRIANAEFALQTTDMTIAEIAELCGYRNEVHFFRQFKQYKGMTPARYRKEHHAVTKP
ncbi:MAG: helix-turn-helix domain-containing protein [Lachnospiraceae bacterium]|nr:helix-turn-helix domain-containing protein [Lachnospiraceae bacterium]